MTSVFVWTVGDVVAALLMACFFVVALIVFIVKTTRQTLCKHPAVYETSACDAICKMCGKNLGFIGTWQKRTVKGK